MSERFCILVPHYNHAAQLAAYLPDLVALGLPVLVVDDGSDRENRGTLGELASRHPGVEVIERGRNGGKGVAVIDGMRSALARGYSHGITVDADGQHDAGDVLRMRDAASAHPDALFSGQPVFGDDIPAARLYGRMITTGLARLEAGTRTLRDGMCGFRCYPLAVTLEVCNRHILGGGMDFDTEILVRAAWHGVPLRFLETRVRYPQGGVSHFRMFRDNVLMTLMHIRLLLGAAIRAPGWLMARLGRGGAG